MVDMPRPHLLVGTVEGLHEVGVQERSHLNGHEILALVNDRHSWWALVDGSTLYRFDRDAVWKEVASLPDSSGTCLGVTASALLVGTAGAHLFRLEGQRLTRIEEFEQVEGRRKWYTPWGDPPDTRSIFFDSTGIVYVNVHVGGIVRSTDAGRSWQPTIDVDADVHQVLAHPSRPSTLLAACAEGLGVSEDRGDSWRFETEGLHARYLRAVAIARDYVLVSASTGPGGRRATLYRKRLGQDKRFERCREGLPEWFGDNIDTSCLAASGQTVACGTEDGRLFLSNDAGASWEPIAKGLPSMRCLCIA